MKDIRQAEKVFNMHRFYVEGCSGLCDLIEITGEDVNHIKNVLRLKTGDEIVISDGNGVDYICNIESIGNTVTAKITDYNANASELPTRIILFQGMPKSDKMEFIIQKAVELGVYQIVPVMTSRTVVKIEPKKVEKKLQRYNSIAMSAAKQSGRGIIPEVKEFMTFKQAVKYACEQTDMSIIPYEEAEGIKYSRSVIKSVKGNNAVGIFIGPEGGFAKEEIDFAIENNFKCITLGNRILRTETAGLAVISIIMFEIEE